MLLFHARQHGFVGRCLDAEFFAARVPEARRLRLDDPLHALRTRYPDEMNPFAPDTRLVSGLLPFGYLDGLGARVIHICVISDPEISFLRFVAELPNWGPAAVQRLTGETAEALPFDDPDALVLRLLAAPAMRRFRVGGLVRLCAGLPAISDRPPDERQLRAAEANLARVNCLCGVEPRLSEFLGWICGIFDWPPFEEEGLRTLPGPLVEPGELGPKARAALLEASQFDRRLFDRQLALAERMVA